MKYVLNITKTPIWLEYGSRNYYKIKYFFSGFDKGPIIAWGVYQYMNKEKFTLTQYQIRQCGGWHLSSCLEENEK